MSTQLTNDVMMRELLINGYIRDSTDSFIPKAIINVLLYYYPYIVKLEYILEEAKLKKADYENRFNKDGMYPYNEIFIQMDILCHDIKRRESLKFLKMCKDLEIFLDSKIQIKLVIKLLNEIDKQKRGIVDVQGLTYFLNFIFIQYAKCMQFRRHQTVPIEHFAMWISREYGIINKNKSNQQYIKTSRNFNEDLVHCFWHKDVCLCYDNFRESIYEWKRKYVEWSGVSRFGL